MMKKVVLLLTALLGLAGLHAAPVTAMPVRFTQPDGSPIEIYASGDEFHNWLHDAEGYTIVKSEPDGWYVYALQDGDGVSPSTCRVGADSPQARGLQPGINLSPRAISAQYDRNSTMRNYDNARSPSTGQFNNLVVFIKFADDPPFADSIGFYHNMFNNNTLNANSMKNYFLTASYDQLTIDSFFFPPPNGTVILTYTDTLPRNYYRPLSASNPNGYDVNDHDERTYREHTLLANCVAYIAPMVPADLDIDGDDDGFVDNVCFIIQGQPDGWAELLWPHRWVLYSVAAYINGAQVWDFNFQLESFLYSSAASVLAHEMFHSLSAPDLYRYYDNTITPIGVWDLMASNTNPPQSSNAWMKFRYGHWLPTPPMITQSGTYTLQPLASSSTNSAYRISSWRSYESYVLEYRKPHGIYDSTLPGSGLLVYRLDTRQQGNADGPPDEMYAYRPNGTNTTINGTISQAFFSEQSGRREINETTVPNGFTGNNLAGGLDIYDIGFAGDTISFKVVVSDVQVTSPRRDNVWFTGLMKNITWKAKTTTGNVKIEFSVDNGVNWQTIINSTSNSGTHAWSVPYYTSDQCFIRVTLLTNNQSDTNNYPFSIIGEICAPLAIYPENGAVNVPNNPTFLWGEVPGATSYNFQLSALPDFSTTIINQLNINSTSFTPSWLEPYTLYYWRVQANSDVGQSEFCSIHSFTTGPVTVIPGVPTLVQPSQAATNQFLNPLLVWNPGTYAQDYHVQLSPDVHFLNDVMEYLDIPTNSFRLPDLLQAQTQYYWRVRSHNDAGFSYFSVIRRFTTGSAVGIEDGDISSPVTRLIGNYPNPFNPSTSIAFEVAKLDETIHLTIYNTRGQAVRNLFSGNPIQPRMSIVWDGKDDSGAGVSSGIYFYRLHSPSVDQTRRMILIK